MAKQKNPTDECAWHQVTCSSIIGALLLEPICLIIALNNWIASCTLLLARSAGLDCIFALFTLSFLHNRSTLLLARALPGQIA